MPQLLYFLKLFYFFQKIFTKKYRLSVKTLSFKIVFINLFNKNFPNKKTACVMPFLILSNFCIKDIGPFFISSVELIRAASSKQLMSI